MSALTYPDTHVVAQTDEYHDASVPDPYRWMEDPADPALAMWIHRQKELTASYLSQLPIRGALRERFDQLLAFPRQYWCQRRGPYLVYTRNAGLEDQLALYVQRGLDGAPELLLQPRALDPSGRSRIASITLSRSGKYLAIGTSTGNAVSEEYRVLDMRSRRLLTERLAHANVSKIAWRGDGFYYNRFLTPATRNGFQEKPAANHQIWYHRVGSPQALDRLVYEDPAHPLRLNLLHTTEDERIELLTVWDPAGANAGLALAVRDIANADSFTAVIESFANQYWPISAEGSRLFLLTDQGAPNRRVVLLELTAPERPIWSEIIPEGEEPIETVVAVGNKWLVVRRHHAAHRLALYDSSGRLEDDIPLPGIGSVQVHEGDRGHGDALWTFAGFTHAPRLYRYDLTAGTASMCLEPSVPIVEEDYCTTQIFVPSTGGVAVPVFLVYRRSTELRGHNTCLLYGYGGNGVALTPAFDPLLIALVERGVVFAVAGLRGGGEYGEEWHRAGSRENKLKTFEDCVAVGEWLRDKGYADRHRMALLGASNGGLLVGAVITRRPDLFKVAVVVSGVLDMLRFHRFSMGWTFVSEYGSSDDPGQFALLRSYSPVHNVQTGVSYPATLVMTNEEDELVAPVHSYKFTAMLQARGVGPHPYLIRVGNGAFHGTAARLSQELDERADLYAFLLTNMGSGPRVDTVAVSRVAGSSVG